MKKGERKQFCINGHDTFECGRTKHGVCIECVKLKKSKNVKKHVKRICIRGHDTFIVGRDKRGHCKECTKNYNNRNKKQIQNRRHTHYVVSKIEILQNRKDFYVKNKDRIILRNVQYINKKMKTDPIFKLKRILRNRLFQAIKRNQKKGSAVKDLGCSIEFLKQYLEAKFYAGMTWNNWGKIWELDHIIPLWKFDLTDREQFLIANNYENLQPLTVDKHKKKSAEELNQFWSLQNDNQTI